MSVAEFAVAASVSLFSLCATHELTRLYACRQTIQLIAHVYAAQMSYQSLSLVLNGTFLPIKGGKFSATEIQIDIEKSIQKALADPLLTWSWVADQPSAGVFNGLRVWLRGPTFSNRQQATEIQIHLCLRSWLEPILKILSDNRNCLGEFESNSHSRGISITLIARREPNISLSPYFSQRESLEQWSKP